MAIREQPQPRRAPLLWLLLPFLLGLLLARFYPGAGNLLVFFPAFGLLLVLALPWARNQETWWYALFPLAVFALSTIYHSTLFERTSPQDTLPSELLPPREAFVELEPVQVFQSPPYANRYSGLARNLEKGQESLWYYSAPGWDRTSPMLPGFSYKLRGVPQPIEQLIGSNDFLSYLQSRGVRMGIRAIHRPEDGYVVSPFEAGISLLRQQAIQSLNAGQPDDSLLSRIYIATVLGMRSGLTSEQKKVFRETGTAHLFAISGLHVGLIGLFLFMGTRFLPVREAVRVFSALTILLCYVLLTGSAPSAVRAFLMIAFLWSARCLGRDYRAESALALSALAVLIYDPNQLFTLGFQLSYCVVFAILIYGVPLAEQWIEDTQRDPWLRVEEESQRGGLRTWFLGSLAISVSAFLGSSPIIVSQFGILPISSIVLNLLLLPLATLLLAFGFLSLGFGFTPLSFLSPWINYGAWPVLDLMRSMVDFGAGVPFSHFSVHMYTNWMGPLWLSIWLVVAFWTSTQPVFRYRYLCFPIALLLLALLGSSIPTT